MIKKSKITVKRFFNKQVNGITVYKDIEEKGHPLYYTITYKRKTQKVKSMTNAVMTEKAFNYLEENNKPLNFETNYLPNAITSPQILKNELSFIYKAVKYIVENENSEDIYDSFFKDRLKRFFSNLKDSLYSIGWNRYKHVINSENDFFKESKDILLFDEKYNNLKENPHLQQQFYYSFNRENNLIYNLNTMNEVLNIDLEPYIFRDTVKMWHVINLINIVYSDTICIDFIINYNENKIIEKSKEYKLPLTTKEIKTACNILKEKVLIFL
ncbi:MULTISPECIES: hypothetical protein [Tenacibaculum]|uniref:hypothetical protein n=1 Tax=Tenacibaculum TaxID=104267 RepID=UPI001EFD4A80|nr:MULTISPECIES: hypothetical protein [Tenacibaculum]MCG8206154.1 hypothetical protein [Tenacibaculum finnmarkense genomovar finnmarkense]MCG8763477.1 hypothetical protein [Tenacibaculum finnmarkense]MCG8763872.1 hypothetical protein [Tenacibaculum finnmarkense]MCG8776547.1 hypothetical protein [Tenacibaculum finnmarkense]MCG8788853.1 hypothetical protein [Tenacibaculum finnmarkense]